MKYTVEIDINLPRTKVIALFDNPDNLQKWMPNLVSFTHLSGEPGQVGAQSKFVLQQGSKTCELIETITARNLPEQFDGTYETDGMWNEVQNVFVDIDNTKTRWIAHTEFKSDKFMMKLIMLIMPGAFRKESLRFMESFKNFAEQEH